MSTIVNTLGAGSGIDTDALITKLVAAQRLNADTQNTARKTDADARVSAMGQVTSALSSFSTALTGLATGGTLSAQAASSNSSVAGVSFTSGSVPLNSSLSVTRLATSQTLSSAAVSDPTAAVGQGTLTINFGTVTDSGGAATGFTPNSGASSSFTITVDQSNDSLNGIAKAINAAKKGVTATVVTDSTGSRLVLKGDTGTKQGFTVSADPALSQFAFGVGTNGGMTLAASAKNAQLTLDGVSVESASNTVSNLISGVKIDLKDTGTTSLTTSRDTSALTQTVSDYVSAYNEVVGLLTSLTKAPSSSTATDGGALRTESSIRDLQNRLASLTTTKLLTQGTGPSSLAEIGVKTNRDGTLTVDTDALTKAVNADPDRIEQLLTSSQASSSTQVAITSAVGKVKTGTYSVTDIVTATAGKLSIAASANAFDTPVVIDSTNHTIKMTVDGSSTLDVTIPDGSYSSGSDLAAAIQTAVNADPTLTAFSKSVNVAWNGAGFDFTSRDLGSTTMVSLDTIDPTLSATLGFGTQTATNGTDASAKINGIAAQGFGNNLVAASTSQAAGLVLQLSANAPSTVTISISGGLVGAMSDLYTSMSTGDGALASALTRIQKEQTQIDDDMTDVDTKSAAYKDQLTTQFANMETAVAAFKSTQDFLTQQIDAWNAAAKNN